MTIKIEGVTVSAPMSVLNVLSMGYQSVADQYYEDGNLKLFTKNSEIAHCIYEELDKAGYYDVSSEPIIKGYHIIDHQTKEGKIYELWESSTYGEDVPVLVVSNGAVIGTTQDSLSEFLNDLE